MLSSLKKWLRDNGLKKESLFVGRLYNLQKYAISRAEAGRLNEWFNDNKSTLSFGELFNGKLRVAIPFNTEEHRSLIEIVSFLEKNGWEPAGGNNLFDVKKVRQKLKRPDTGEEYEEEIEIADLKVQKREEVVIPSGPRKGERVVKKYESTISKVLANPKNDPAPWMSGWWQKKQAEYVKNYNWNQIESAFRDGGIVSEHSIVISRSPIDVLRMSDHRGISSCHSEGNSYFQCAVSESRGNGLVAYLVKTSELNSLVGDNGEIGDLDDQEVFADPERRVEGIRPKSRIRLRKYVNTKDDYEFAAPEHRTYGPHPPGFKQLVRKWAWERQKHLFGDDVDLHISDLEMHGGSYRDTSDGEILNSFFEEGGFDTSFYGNAETESEDEQNVADMWEEEVEQVLEHANNELENASFWAEVDVYDGEHPYVSAQASIYCEIELSGWDDIYYEDDHAKTRSGFKDIPVSYRNTYEFKNLLSHPEYGEIEEISVESGQLKFSVDFRCDDCTNPDDVSDFYDYVRRDIDLKYDEYIEKVRKTLLNEGYIGEIEFDRAGKRLSSKGFENFNIFGGEEDDFDGEILISSKPSAFKLSIAIPEIIMRNSDDHRKTLSSVLNAEASLSRSSYRLKDEAPIVIKVLNEIANDSNEQLRFPFYKEDKEGAINFNEALESLELGIRINDMVITEIDMRIRLMVKDSEHHILFLEKFIDNLDKNVFKTIGPITDSLVTKIKDAAFRADTAYQSFLSGNISRPIIEKLKGHSQPDVKRLALWIEKNWNNFTDAEKEVAHYSYLLPVERDGDYVHRDDLNAPRFWDSIMQGRPGTDISYRWTGLSMRDVMPYTDLNAPIGEGLPPDNELEQRLAYLSLQLKKLGHEEESAEVNLLAILHTI